MQVWQLKKGKQNIQSPTPSIFWCIQIKKISVDSGRSSLEIQVWVVGGASVEQLAPIPVIKLLAYSPSNPQP